MGPTQIFSNSSGTAGPRHLIVSEKTGSQFAVLCVCSLSWASLPVKFFSAHLRWSPKLCDTAQCSLKTAHCLLPARKTWVSPQRKTSVQKTNKTLFTKQQLFSLGAESFLATSVTDYSCAFFQTFSVRFGCLERAVWPVGYKFSQYLAYLTLSWLEAFLFHNEETQRKERGSYSSGSACFLCFLLFRHPLRVRTIMKLLKWLKGNIISLK